MLLIWRLQRHILHDLALVDRLFVDALDPNGASVFQRFIPTSDGVESVLDELGCDLRLVLRFSELAVLLSGLNDVGAVAVVGDSADYSALRHVVRL